MHAGVSEEIQTEVDEEPAESSTHESTETTTANIGDVLESLGLGKKKQSFEEQGVNLDMMIEMDTKDLKECRKEVMVNKYSKRYMVVQKIRDIKDANKGTAVNATSMKEGRQFEACNKEDTPINCTICNNRF